MPISQVALSNTFNEFRSTFNDAANTVNSFTAGTGEISANTITSATLTSGRVPLVSTSGLIVDDSNLTYNTSTDILTLGGATDASSTTTGTLIVTGGVGVAKKLYVGTDLTVTANTTLSGTTESTSTTTGSLKTAGGLGVVKNLFVGGIVDVANTTESTSVTTGALIVDGGAGIAKNMYVGGDMQVTGNLTILGSNTSLSTTQIVIEDNILQLSHLNSSDVVDIGFIGGYNNGANVHSGFFRDASDGTWKLFKDYNVEPSTTIDVSGNGFAYANLVVDSLQANNKITTTGGVDKLTYATGAISVADSSTPSNGQVLTATGSTTATWQTPSAGGVTTGKAIAMALVFGG